MQFSLVNFKSQSKIVQELTFSQFSSEFSTSLPLAIPSRVHTTADLAFETLIELSQSIPNVLSNFPIFQKKLRVLIEATKSVLDPSGEL
jgi:hypothetical protein